MIKVFTLGFLFFCFSLAFSETMGEGGLEDVVFQLLGALKTLEVVALRFPF